MVHSVFPTSADVRMNIPAHQRAFLPSDAHSQEERFASRAGADGGRMACDLRTQITVKIVKV